MLCWFYHFFVCGPGTGGELHFKYLCNNTTVIDLKQQFIPEYYVKYPPVSKMYGFFSLKYYNISVHVLTTLATFTQQVEQNNAFYKQYHQSVSQLPTSISGSSQINTLASALSTSTTTRSRRTICTGSGVHLA